MTYDETEAQRRPFEDEHIPLVRAVLEAQGRQLAEAIRAEDFPLSAFLDREPMREALTALWAGTITHFAGLGAREVESIRAVPDDGWQQVVQRFIQSVGGTMIRNIDATTLDLVREVLREGVQEGWGVGRIARELEDVWPDLARVRSERIVRTEVVRASNYGSFEGAKYTAGQAGLDLKKEWIATSDGRTRDTHIYANGQQVGLGEAFTVGGHQAQYPGDPALPAAETVNCRCTIGYVPLTKSWRDERDEQIRTAYPSLRDRWGSVQAKDELSEEHALSVSQIERILYRGTRS